MSLKSRVLFSEATFDVGLRLMVALCYGHSPVATHPFFARAYEVLAQHGGPKERLSRSQTAFSIRLPEIEVPALDQLSFDEMRRLREDSAAFGAWRHALDSVLAHMPVDLEPEPYCEKFREVASAELTLAADRLEAEVKASSALKASRKAGRTFAVGLIAAAVPVVLTPVIAGAALAPALAKAGMVGGTSAVLNLLFERKAKSGDKALLSHYAVFREH
jgi:hypothetical protein